MFYRAVYDIMNCMLALRLHVANAVPRALIKNLSVELKSTKSIKIY